MWPGAPAKGGGLEPEVYGVREASGAPRLAPGRRLTFTTASLAGRGTSVRLMQQRNVTLGPLDLKATFGAMTMKAVGRIPAAPGEAWWTAPTPDGPATLHATQHGADVRGEAWGPGSAWVLERLPQLIGAHDDPAAFRPGPGILSELHRRNQGLRLGRTGLVFAALVPTILGQRVTTVSAERSYRALVRAHGTPAPGPLDAWVAPPAEVVAQLSYEDFHVMGVERSRAVIIIETARRARRLEETTTMDLEAANRRLTAVRGIGPWTAAQVAGSALGDTDAVPTGDFHLPNMVAWALAGEPRGDDERMLELLEPYRGHRRRVLVLLKGAGIHAPKYGPKNAVRDIRGQ